jgi:hypothetical protein
MTFAQEIWNAVAKVTCLDCLHPECLAIGDAASELVSLCPNTRED